MRELPLGTITLLFADTEQSTALVQRLEAERCAEVLARYRGILREAVSAGVTPLLLAV
jgi:class 3 adenylate cyclase